MWRREAYTGLLWEHLRGRDHWVDPGKDGRIILGCIFRMWGFGDMDWIGLTQDRDR
jgi:hypothetical protein